MDTVATIETANPLLIRRNNGGWLAIAPKNATFLIGITADTADEAEEKFRTVYNRWISIFISK